MLAMLAHMQCDRAIQYLLELSDELTLQVVDEDGAVSKGLPKARPSP